MKLIKILSIAVLLAFVAGCALDTHDIKTNTKVDSKANFAGYKTYSWLGTAAIINDPLGQWEPSRFDADAEIKYAIDTELRKRKIMESSNNPDLLVGFAAGIDMAALELVENPETKMQLMKNVPKGALVIVLVDNATGFPIWVGEAMADYKKERSPEESSKRIRYAVKKLFSELPPVE